MMTGLLVKSGIHPILVFIAFTPFLWFGVWMFLEINFPRMDSPTWVALAIIIVDCIIGMILIAPKAPKNVRQIAPLTRDGVKSADQSPQEPAHRPAARLQQGPDTGTARKDLVEPTLEQNY
ncbi:MAG: hypothetical protein AWU57_307 [Marinobacter sp. T13-3]|nr:MAG: hypothetical protein AWU57_307 [Marinobacter sp. T13-3]